MLPLRELQSLFARTLTAGDAAALDALLPLIGEDGISPAERIAIYTNNVAASLTDVLKETFPAVCRIVDERFFSYAAHQFIAAQPPRRPALAEYGAEFADFFASFPPCRELCYLADVARLEWLMNQAAHAGDAAPIGPDALAGVAPEDAGRLVFEFEPSIGYLASKYPVDAIWRANRSAEAGEESIALDAGGVFLEVRRIGNDVVFRQLDRAGFDFRQALKLGAQLEEAIAHAFRESPEFAAGDAVGALFFEHAVVRVSLSPLKDHSHAGSL